MKLAGNEAQKPHRLLIIHHSHTDVGYTDMQQRIEIRHIDFIRQALDIIAQTNNDLSADRRFVWNCESFWAVERFFKHASDDEKEHFVQAVRDGHLGLSGNYLNFNELLAYGVLFRMTKRAADFGDRTGVPVDSAMTADINGFGWGFSQALHDCRIKNLFTCIHTHHGMCPLGRRHTPFWWQTPKGDKILVWIGEHYHFGNELGIVPGAISSYIIKDECDAEMIFGKNRKVAEIRIPRFVNILNDSGYPYDYVPIMASGLRTDNGPPNAHILEFIRSWNNERGHEIQLEMATLSDFFRLLRKEKIPIPTYRGDWPDWWSDGTASAPAYTRLFRETQRDLRYYENLMRKYPETASDSLDLIDYHLALYAEHTFGHADSISQPWHFLTHAIAARKKAYIASAYGAVQRLLDDAITGIGATVLKTDMPLKYRIINPLEQDISGLARLPVSHFEFNELGLDKGALVRELGSEEEVPHQLESAPLGAEFCIYTRIPAGGEKEYEIIPRAQKEKSIIDNVSIGETSLETPFVNIVWRLGDGIVSWLDKTENLQMLRSDRNHNPFPPVYELTPVPDEDKMCAVRGEMLLNRKGVNVKRSVGRIKEINKVETGPVFARAVLSYSVEGFSRFYVELRAYVHEPRVDVILKMHKNSVWEPENVYLALPFRPPGDCELWLDKVGAKVCPRIDQIPGTLIDFYSIQEGLTLTSPAFGIIIATPDTNLIQIGPLDHGTRKLHNPENKKPDDGHIYAWLMTNFWETNFDADLGGFYEFRYSILWGKSFSEPNRALQYCRDINHGLKSFRLRKEKQ